MIKPGEKANAVTGSPPAPQSKASERQHPGILGKRSRNEEEKVPNSSPNRGGPRKAKIRVWTTLPESVLGDEDSGSAKQECVPPRIHINRGGSSEGENKSVEDSREFSA